MLHLLPIRWVLTALIALVGVALLAAVYAGFRPPGNIVADMLTVVRLASVSVGLFIVLSFALWIWLPVLHSLTFLYLGGVWSGRLNYSGARSVGTRDISLKVFHNHPR